MAGMQIFGIHRTWEDWFGMILGVVIGFSPWLAGQAVSEVATWNTLLVGALVLLLAMLQLVSLRLWESVCEIICGLWLILSPVNFGYGDALATWHLVLGSIVILLAAVELWQDWRLSESELAQHGQ